ncbi:aminopeptidase N isoform X2 [Onthophagus taurus]
MTHVSEKLDIMDAISPTRKPTKDISISRLLLVIILTFFALTIITTSLLTYYLSPKVTNIIQNDCKSNPTTLSLTQIDDDVQNNEEEQTDLDTSTPEMNQIEVTTKSFKEEMNLRLPRSIKPNFYRLFMLPFLIDGNLTFNGNVSINITVEEATKIVTLHVDELEIEPNSVEILLLKDKDEKKESLKVVQLSNDTTKNFFNIHLEEDLKIGMVCEIRMRFKGVLNDILEGFYRSSYVLNDTKRWIAVTQFQPTDARKAFPCFDEPALKAKFQVNLGRSKEMSSISNMPKFKSTPISNLPGYYWDHFETSVPMSTYLVAFVISDFDHLTNQTVSIWFRQTMLNQAGFALKVSPALLTFYEEYFQLKFPLPKIDMVALPDFSTGAMENWGLITYRESVLLYDPEKSTKFNMQVVLIVVAHELAHQWFGNLVSPLWWDDLWLNEGFATFMEYLSVDSVYPELKVMDQFVVHELQGVLTIDALKYSHPVSVKVENPDEINNIFDGISYAKGATIIRMMEHFLSTKVFRAALTNYLLDRKYSNAEQDDLWRFLTNQAHLEQILDQDMSVKIIMDSWTLQTGFPVITVTRNYKNRLIKFKQERFLVAGNSSGVDSSLWWVPLTYSTKNDGIERKTWLKSTREITINSDLSPDEWLLVNLNLTGYYRVNYDEKNWYLLIEEINSKEGYLKFDPKNRAQLLDDSFNLANGGYLDYSIALNVTKYLVYERDAIPWKTAFITIEYLYNIFSRTGHFDLYKKYALYLLRNLYEDIGFYEKPSDSPLLTQTRALLLMTACKLGYKDCIINCINEFQKWRSSADPDRNNPISANLRGTVYCYAIRTGGQEEWDFAWERYLKTEVAAERELLMTGLGCSREPWILRRYLEWAVTEKSGIRKHDAIRIFVSITDSIIGQHIAYNFLKTDWDRIKKYMGSTLMSGIIRECITLYPTQEELDDIKSLVSKRKEEFSVFGRLINQLIEKAEANLIWRKTNLDKIILWLSTHDYNS